MNFSIVSPRTTDDLLKAIKQNQGGQFRFGAGFTDLIPEIKRKNLKDFIVINLAQLEEVTFTSINDSDLGIRIGSLVTMVEMLSDKRLRVFKVLIQAIESLASAQIRSVATVGGNLCTASPAGDVSCALVALGSICEILTVNGEIKRVSLADFFTGVKTTILRKNEILRSVLIPPQHSSEKIVSGFIKVGNRNSMEIALASFAYHITLDKNERITSAGAAVGSVAEKIKYTETACELLLGKKMSQLTERMKEDFADNVLSYANPISDLRASAWYRRKVLWNISKSIF